MKDDIKKLIKGVRTLHNDQAISMLCDELEKAIQFNEDTLAAKLSLNEENQRLRTSVEHLEATLNAVIEAAGEDWQDADDLPNVVKAMADLAKHRQAAPASQNQQLLEQMIGDLRTLANPQNPTVPQMSPEMFRQNAALAAMNGMLASGSVKYADVAIYAVKHADALVQELAK